MLATVLLITGAVSAEKTFIGYWGSAADKPKLDQLPEALKRGYNVISLAFGDMLTASGGFQVDTNLGAPPTKLDVSEQANVDSSSWKYILSFGGQNAAGPAITDEDAYVNGFLASYGDASAKYGFDGIDIDIETGMTTPLLRCLRRIFKTLHAEGQVISMAPQPLNIDPVEVRQFMEGSYNAYVPLIDTTMINYVTYIATQLYNNPMPLGSLEAYIDSMQSNSTISWDGNDLYVNIPSEKFVFGYPAASGAAPSGPAEAWESSGADILAHYQASPTLMKTGGAMTWSVGWDAENNWEWITHVSQIWETSELEAPKRASNC